MAVFGIRGSNLLYYILNSNCSVLCRYNKETTMKNYPYYYHLNLNTNILTGVDKQLSPIYADSSTVPGVVSSMSISSSASALSTNKINEFR